MKLILSLILLTSSMYAYEGCGIDKNEALSSLSRNIKTRISTNFTQNTKVSQDDTVENKISSYLSTSANLTLVNINYTTNEKNEKCAHIEHDDQTKNTKKLLNKALTYQEYDLPEDINKKIQKLETYLNDIDELNYLIPVFLEDTDEKQKELNKKEKLFQDLYDSAIKKENSLVWRECQSSKESAKSALNERLFVNKGLKKEKGFWDSLTSAFSSTAPSDIDLFNREITYMKKDSKDCAIIKKSDLLKVSTSMNNEVKNFNEKSLNINPIKKYDQIELYTKQFEITKKLLSLFPDAFKNNDFSNLARANEVLIQAKKTTFPQYVSFSIKNATDIKIKLDNKFVDNNIEHYINVGEHTYEIKAKDRCPIKGSFSISLKDNENISEDFDDYKYPTAIFITTQDATIVVDGNNFTKNKTLDIKKCSDEPLRYLAKFSGQSRDGEIDVSANAKNTIELKFLTAKELEIFNNASTLNFKTTSGVKFSETLTPQTSPNLEYNVGLGDSVSHGDLNLNSKGSFVYVSKKDFVGIDSFTYTISANSEQSAPKVVNITVEKSNAPVAVIPLVIAKDKNTTKEQPKEKVKEEKKKEEKSEVSKDEKKEERYNRYKELIEKTNEEKNVEKFNKLRESYPYLFDRFLKEKSTL